MSRPQRHPIALMVVLLVLASALVPLPSLVDAVTGFPPGDAELVRPTLYVALAPLSTTLDALTFLSIERARWALAVWAVALVLISARHSGSRLRRVGQALAGLFTLVLLVAATLVLPRPVARLDTEARAVTVIDYHAHTEASHDGRKGWTSDRLARWHARQGFEASYVTDHNLVFPGASSVIELLPGAEWSVHRQHVIALGSTAAIDRDRFHGTTQRMLGIFGALDRQGVVSIAALPEYWRNHWADLDAVVSAGANGFEIVDCAPKALGFPPAARRRVIALARRHDLVLVGASDNHGWGAATCVWNLAAAGAGGLGSNRVIARSIALAQGEGPAWAAAVTQPWLMFQTLSWSERVSWLTWVAVLALYRAVPRRDGQGGGLSILARSLKLRALFRRKPAEPQA